MFCTEWTLVKYSGGVAEASCLKCRSWGCPVCQPERAATLRAQAREGRPNTFITLTVNPAFLDSPVERARALADAWRVIVRKAKRRYSYKRLEYLAVFEATKAGEPHLHILARCKWLDQRWLSEQMNDLMQAPVVDIRRVKSARQAANYVSKYIGKDPQRFGKCKRYWKTRAWDKWRADREPKDEGRKAQWKVERVGIVRFVWDMTDAGYVVDWIKNRAILRYGGWDP